MLRLYTLGRLQLVRGEAPAVEVIPVQDKRLAVLAYLALGMADGPQRRDTILGVFWPDLDQGDARRALRQSLYHLRNVVGDGVIVRDGDDLAVAGDRLWCDAAQIVTGAPPADVLGWYRGDFLAGFFASGVSPAFEEWLDRTRTRLRRLAVDAAWQVAREAAAAREISTAIGSARRAVEMDPDDEGGGRRLMALLDEFGDRAGALAVHRELTQRLKTHFNSVPAPETEALAAAIRRRQAPAPQPDLPPPQRAEPASPPAAVVRDDISPAAPDRPRRPVWRRPAVRWVAAFLLVAAAALLARRGGSASLRESGRLAASDRLLVEEFADLAQDADLAAAVTSLVRVDLARSTLPVMGSVQLRDALHRMGVDSAPSPEQVRELAIREGVHAIVQGSVARVGTGFAVTTEVVSPESGEVLLTLGETAADSTQLIAAVGRVASALRRRIGEPLSATRGRPPLERVTTPSLTALRSYTAAERLKAVGQDRERELTLLRQAVAADSGFAMAWLGLANLYWTTGQLDQARAAAIRAHHLADRLPPRERLSAEASYYEQVERDQRRVAEAYLGMIERDSTDFRILHNLGLTYQALHEYDRQVEYARLALQWSDSAYSVVWLALLQGLVNAGRLDEARSTLAAAQARYPNDPYLRWIEAYIAQNEGDYATVDRVGRTLGAMTDNAEHAGEGNRILADLHELRGRSELAAGYRWRALSIAETEGAYATVVDDLARLARLTARTSPDSARRFFQSEVAARGVDSLPAASRPFEALELAYVELGLPARARDEVARSRNAGVEPSPVVERLLEADAARSRRDVAAVVRALQSAADEDECPVCLLPALATAQMEAGQPDSAAATLRRYLETPYIHRLSADAQYLPSVLSELARFEEARGEPERGTALRRQAESLTR